MSDIKRQKKKKQREVEVHKKIINRRNNIRKAEIEKKEKEKKAEIAAFMENGPMLPFKKPETLEKEKALLLKRNAKLLKELEKQWLKENKNKSDLNAQLEAEGFSSIEEKLDFLKKQAEEKVKK